MATQRHILDQASQQNDQATLLQRNQAPPAPPEQPPMLVKIDEKLEAAVATIDTVVSECGLMALGGGTGSVRSALILARGVQMLRDALRREIMEEICKLQGTKLGFRTDLDTDREGRRYGMEVVKDCVIEAMMKGARVVGNEFNIIASNTYFTKEYFKRVMAECPGLTDLVLEFGVPQLVGEGALVPAKASWRYRGKQMQIVREVVRGPDGKPIADNRIPVRVNKGMGVDAILGKAERKLRAQVWERITGTTFTDADSEDADALGTYVDATVVGGNGDPSEQLADALERGSVKQPGNQNGEHAEGAEAAEDTISRRREWVKFGAVKTDNPQRYIARMCKAIEAAQTQEDLAIISDGLNGAAAIGELSAEQLDKASVAMEQAYARLRSSAGGENDGTE